jgi:hypothetical protein
LVYLGKSSLIWASFGLVDASHCFFTLFALNIVLNVELVWTWRYCSLYFHFGSHGILHLVFNFICDLLFQIIGMRIAFPYFLQMRIAFVGFFFFLFFFFVFFLF